MFCHEMCYAYDRKITRQNTGALINLMSSKMIIINNYITVCIKSKLFDLIKPNSWYRTARALEIRVYSNIQISMLEEERNIE